MFLVNSLREIPFSGMLPTFENIKNAWSYTSKVVSISTNTLNAVSADCRISVLANLCPKSLKKTATVLKLTSIIGIPFDLVELKKTIDSTRISWKERCYRDAAVSAISLPILTLGVIDSTLTFINAVKSLKQLPQVYTGFSLPAAAFMVVTGTATRSIKMIRAHMSGDKKVNMRLESVALATNFLVLSALWLYKKGNSTPLPPVLIAAAFAVRLGSQIYQNRLSTVRTV